MIAHIKTLVAFGALTVTALWSSNVQANDWDANLAAQPGNGPWNTALNWSTNVVPVPGESVNIGTAAYPNSTVTLSGTNGTSGLTRIATVAGTSELIIDGVSLTVNSGFLPGSSAVSGANGRVHLKNNAVLQVNGLGGGSTGSTANFQLDSGTQLIANSANDLDYGDGAYTITMAGNALLQFNASPSMRQSATATAEVRGAGFITTAGIMRADARFIADGGTLDHHFVGSGFYLTNALPRTQGTGDPSGYYAINGGKVVLGGSLAWGQLGSGTSSSGPRSEGSTIGSDPDTINSVQYLNIAPGTNVTNPATVDVEILALDLVSGLSGVVGAWNINNQDSFITTATGIQIRFRYNDIGVASEGTLKLFENLGSGWSLVPGSVLNAGSNWITSGNLVYNLSDAQSNSMGMFAVAQAIEAEAVPEPTTYALGLLALAGFGLLAWRKRNRSCDCCLMFDDSELIELLNVVVQISRLTSWRL